MCVMMRIMCIMMGVVMRILVRVVILTTVLLVIVSTSATTVITITTIVISSVSLLMVVTMMPLGISPESKALSFLAPGLLWVIALLATLLSLDSLFRSDYEDGSLEQLILSPQSLYFMVIGKVLSHWLTTGLPLTFVAPLLGVLLALPAEGYLPLLVSLFSSTTSPGFS